MQALRRCGEDRAPTPTFADTALDLRRKRPANAIPRALFAAPCWGRAGFARRRTRSPKSPRCARSCARRWRWARASTSIPPTGDELLESADTVFLLAREKYPP